MWLVMDYRECPSHEVEIDAPFFIGQRPVTQMHWETIMGYNPSKFQQGWSSGLRPVDSVTLQDCIEFISRLNQSHNNKQRLSLDGIWRLPTEAEWEYSARSAQKQNGVLGTSMETWMIMDGTQVIRGHQHARSA